MDQAHQQRSARAETLFRHVNDRDVLALHRFRDGIDDGSLSIMCECALDQCRNMVHVPPATYRRVRAEPTWFIIQPEHVLPAIETVVEQAGCYWIVSKVGVSAVVAREARA